jgi:CspA family cold shock protein
MPTGRVKFFDDEKGFGFIASDEGNEVFLHASALPEGTNSVRPGSRVEFSIVDGRRGVQALSVRILEVPKITNANRKPAEDMAVIVEDIIGFLDQLGSDFKRGRYPENNHGKKVATLLRKVADELDVD